MGSQIERLNRLDVDRLNNTMDQLPKLEESLLSLVRHLEEGALKSVSLVPALMKSTTEEIFPKFTASRSGKGKVGEEEGTPPVTNTRG